MRSLRVFVITGVLAVAASVISVPVEIASAAPLNTTVVVPSNGATVSGTQVVLDAIASSGVTQVQFELTGRTGTVVVTATPTFYGWLTEWDSSTVANGTYSLQSIATSSGGQTDASPGISITVNNSQGTIVATKNANVLKAYASYDALQSNLYLSNISLYQGLPSNSCDPYSCLWPFTNPTAGTVFLYGVPGSQQFLADVDARLTRSWPLRRRR